MTAKIVPMRALDFGKFFEIFLRAACEMVNTSEVAADRRAVQSASPIDFMRARA